MQIEVRPVPDTVARLVGDVLHQLLEQGEITIEQETAGHEINAVWRGLEDLFAKYKAAATSELDDALTALLRMRHQPWASLEIEKKLAPGVTRYGLVWRVCNLNWPLEFVAMNTGLERSTVLRALRESLDVYRSVES